EDTLPLVDEVGHRLVRLGPDDRDAIRTVATPGRDDDPEPVQDPVGLGPVGVRDRSVEIDGQPHGIIPSEKPGNGLEGASLKDRVSSRREVHDTAPVERRPPSPSSARAYAEPSGN